MSMYLWYRRIGNRLLAVAIFCTIVAPFFGWIPAVQATTGAESATRIYTMGFERNTTTADHEYTGNIGTTGSISTSTVRSGTYALRTNLGASGTSGIYWDFATGDTGTTAMAIRAYVRIATLPSTTINLINVSDSAIGSNTVQGSIRLSSGGVLSLWNEEDSTQIGSDYGTALSTNTWYRIELYADFGTAATGDTTLRGSIDGIEFASSTTVNWANGFRRFRLGILTSATGDIYWDDIAVNQAAYTGQVIWPGEGKVGILLPNGNGTNTAWINGTNSSDYAEVDDPPSSGFDDATTYVECNAISQLEDYAYQDSSTLGISATDRIRLVEAWARVGYGTGTNAARTHSVSIISTGTDTGPNTSINSTSWFTNDDGVPRNAEIVSYDLPGSTNVTPWTTTSLDAVQTRLNTSDCTPTVRVTAIWLTVEYITAESGRIRSNGFELQSVTSGVEMEVVTGSPTISTTTYHGGAASLRINSLSSGVPKGSGSTFVGANSNGPYFFRAYLYVSTLPSADNTIFSILDSGSTARMYIKLASTGALKLFDEDGQVGSDSTALSTGSWYRIEMKFDGTGAGSTDIIEGKIDGTVFATSSTRDISTGVTSFATGGNFLAEAQTTGDWYIDDLAVNQAVGTTQNDYPGEGYITHLRPNANGDSMGWTLSGCATDGYLCVDEVTPDDTSTKLTISTVNTLFDVNLDNSSTGGIGANDTISLVQVGVRANNTGTTTMAYVLRLKDAASGPTIESDQILTNSTTWYTNQQSSPRNYMITASTRPLQSTAWTPTTLDSAQIGAREDTDSTGTLQISALWLLVEYVPSAATPTFSLSSYRWYSDSDSENVTDPWGSSDIAENTAIAVMPAANLPPASGEELRLRVGITIATANLSVSSQQFTLQYKAGTDASCTTGSWTDVYANGDSGIWKFATSSVTDGENLSVAKLTGADVLQEYAKSNPTATNHNSATIGQEIEYDFHLLHNSATEGTTYSFRVVESDGTEFATYTNCPTLTTSPGMSMLMRHGNFFSEEAERGFFW